MISSHPAEFVTKIVAVRCWPSAEFTVTRKEKSPSEPGCWVEAAADVIAL
jgi:hypothetical protein